MHTSKDDYLINSLRFVSAKEETQIYGAILPESLTSPEMKETKAYNTYFVSTEEPTRKSNRVKRPAKKSTQAPTRGFVIRETPEIRVSKKNDKVDVARVRRKSMRDFHKTHPSGSGTVTKPTLSIAIIKPSVTNEATGVKPGVPDVTEEESSESESESWGNDEDDSNNDQYISGEDSDQENASDDDKTQSDNENESNSEHEKDENESDSESDQEENEEGDEDDEEEEEEEVVKTPSNDSDDEDEAKITDKVEGDEDEEMDYTTSQLYDDVDIRLNEPVDTDKGFVQEEGTNAELTNIQQVIYETSPTYSIIIPQSIPSFTPPPPQSTPNPRPTTEATNPPSTLLNFASVFQFDNRATTLEKKDVELKKDPLHTQVTALVDEHLDTKLGATRDEFMNFLSKSLTTRITKQVKDQLPQILPEVVSNFAPPVIQKMVTELLEHVVLARESSQLQSSYEAAATLTEFELKKILIDKMDKSKSYLAALEHRECYEGLKKSYDLEKTLLSTYDKAYSLNRNQKDKDKDEDPSTGSDRGLKKKKTSKDAESAKGPKAKESQPGSSKGDKSQPKSSGKSVQSEEPEFEVTPQQGQSQSWLMTPASSAKKPSKTFDELMSTPIDFSAFIMNGLKINNLTQEILGLTFRLLKGTRSSYAELEYDFEECYKALSEKLDWENPEGGDYPFDLTKPLPLVMSGNCQKVPVDYFLNNDLKYLQGGVLTMTYTTFITKTKAAQ
ncbi:hypothetical protein Tco_0285687 [Tanacetum coccineum]